MQSTAGWPETPPETPSAAVPGRQVEPPGSGRARVDFIPFPPTSFPHRDLLVLEQLQVEPDDRVCEVGVGGGETAARIARLGAAEVAGIDISGPAVDGIRDLERLYPNLRLHVLDVTEAGAVAPLAGRYTAVFSCDTLEHVTDPEAYFQAISDLLAPGGRFLVAFPNEPETLMHGITRFDEPAELERLTRSAGLEARLGAARLAPGAAKVAEALGWKPLELVRSAVRTLRIGRAREGGAGAAPPPQTFAETRFFRDRRLWRRLSPAVNLYWTGVLRLMAARGPSFEVDWEFRRTPFVDCQVVVTGRKPQPMGNHEH